MHDRQTPLVGDLRLSERPTTRVWVTTGVYMRSGRYRVPDSDAGVTLIGVIRSAGPDDVIAPQDLTAGRFDLVRLELQS